MCFLNLNILDVSRKGCLNNNIHAYEGFVNCEYESENVDNCAECVASLQFESNTIGFVDKNHCYLEEYDKALKQLEEEIVECAEGGTQEVEVLELTFSYP